MRLISRNDTSLAVGLIAATVVVFQQPLRYLFDMAQEIESRYHVDLLPALTILVSVFVFHQYRKRQLARADARTAAAEAAQERARSAELERLMTFGQTLANALEPSTLQRALLRHLPTFARDREFWLLTRNGERWEPWLLDPGARLSADGLDLIADRAVAQAPAGSSQPDGIEAAGALCFPLIAGSRVVGVLGIVNPSGLAHEERKMLGAAAAVAAIAIKNMQLFLETREYGLRDSLTGCFTRGHGLELLDRELKLSSRMRRPLSIVMFDVDDFKTINDELGHLCGDELLRSVGAQLTRVLRTTDIRARYGGDEFLIILPDTPSLGAEQVAQCLCREIGTLTASGATRTVHVTASLGVATTANGELEANALIALADAALYQAKRAGRNCFSVAKPAPSTPTAPAHVIRMHA